MSRKIPLPLYTAEREARDAIIKALEPHLRPQLRGMTWTAWRQRFGRYCLDMAQSGVSPEEVVAAWEDVCEEWGAFVYSMRVVQDRIASGAGSRKPRRADPKQGCECELSVADCLRLHADDSGPRPLWEIIAEQQAAGVYSGSIARPLRKAEA